MSDQLLSPQAGSKTTTVHRYAIDPSHSSAEFAVKHLRIATVKGRIGIGSGEVLVDPAHPEAARVFAELPLATISTGDEKRDAHILDRTEWGLTWNAALETGGVLVGDNVKVELNVQLVERK